MAVSLVPRMLDALLKRYIPPTQTPKKPVKPQK